MRKTRIRRFSKKRAKQNAEYLKLRNKYLEDHTICEVCNERAATQIHHRAGRLNSLLCNVEFFLGTCFECHAFIHDHPAAAKTSGWSIERKL